MTSGARVTSECKSLRRLRWSLRLRRVTIWIVVATGVAVPVLLAVALRSEHKPSQHSTRSSALTSCLPCHDFAQHGRARPEQSRLDSQP
jgi:cytochrome c553